MVQNPTMFLRWNAFWAMFLLLQVTFTQSASPTQSAAPLEASSFVYFANENGLCNSTTAHANATGTLNFTPAWKTAQLAGFGLPARPLPDASWLVTVKENSPGHTKSTLWFNTGTQNGRVQEYWDDTLTQFDACAFIFRQGLAMNTIRLGQNDPGDCTSMFTPDCRTAIIEKAESAAASWVEYSSDSPGNITGDALAWICMKIAKSFADSDDQNVYTNRKQLNNFPSACDIDFNQSEPSVEVVQLTGHNKATVLEDGTNNDVGADSNVNWDCPITDNTGKNYSSAFGFTSGSYDLQTRMTTPILSVFFNLANQAAQRQYIQYATAQFSCPRVTNFNEGSRISPKLPAGTPFPTETLRFKPLTTRGFIGTVIWIGGCLLLVGGGITYVRITKGREARRRGEKMSPDWSSEEDVFYETTETKRHELSSVDRKPEIDGVEILETGDADGAMELDAVGSRWSINSSRRSLQSFDTAGS